MKPLRRIVIDTAAFFARFNERAAEHERSCAVIERIRSGAGRYDSLFTSRYVLQEFAPLMLRTVGHWAVVRTLGIIREATSFNVLPVDDATFDRTCTEFARYDDQ